MAEARGAEVDLLLRGHCEHATHCGRREEAHDEVLQECLALLEEDVGAAGEVGGLLEEDSVGSENLADVDDGLELLGGEDGIHERDVGGAEVG